MVKKEMLDYICEALEKKEVKAGFIIIEVETGENKTFQGIELIAADFKGDNKSLAKRFFEEGCHDIDSIGSEFLTTLFKEYDKNHGY